MFELSVKICMFAFDMAYLQIIILFAGVFITAGNIEDTVMMIRVGDQQEKRVHSLDTNSDMKWRSIHSEFEFQVDASKVVKNLTGFWKSTGFW